MKPSEFDKALRSALKADPRSDNEIAVAAETTQATVSRYRNGSKGKATTISWPNAAKLLAALRFRLERDQ